MGSITLEPKERFTEKYRGLTDFEKYWRSVQAFTPKCIRVNTLKSTDSFVVDLLSEQGYVLSRVPWLEHAYDILGDYAGVSEQESHHDGAFFFQNSVSQIPAVVLDPKPGEIVLDVCASPGGKTTQIAALMENTGIIIANEALRGRMGALHANLQRCGVLNTVEVHESGDRIQPAFQFDKILLDAPCTGSGLIKGPTAVSSRTLLEWNPNTILRMAKLQKALILHSYSLLKAGGMMVYSTCSLEPEEDEGVIDFLCSRTDAVLERPRIGIKGEGKKYLKIWPQDQNTFGFFVAKILKPGDYHDGDRKGELE